MCWKIVLFVFDYFIAEIQIPGRLYLSGEDQGSKTYDFFSQQIPKFPVLVHLSFLFNSSSI